MTTRKLALLSYPAVVALSVLASACKNDVNAVEFVQENPPAEASTGTGDVPDSDRLNRMAKQAFLKPNPASEPPPSERGFIPVKMVKKGSTIKSEPPLAPLRHTRTKLVEFRRRHFPITVRFPIRAGPFST